MLLKIAGAGLGATAGAFVFQKWIAKQADGSGFIEVSPGIGLDDVVLTVFMGLGAFGGLHLASKISK